MFRSISAVLIVPILLIACTGAGRAGPLEPREPETPGTPTLPAQGIITDAPSSAVVGGTIDVAMVVTDANGSPVPGVPVDWSAGGGAEIGSGQSETDAAGVAVASVTVGRKAGDRTVSAKAGDLAPVTVSIRAVAGPPANVVLSSDSLRLHQPGDTATLTAAVTDSYGNALDAGGLRWSSSDPAVAQVSSGGRVTAVSRGNAAITANLGNAISATQAWVVPLGVFTITFDDARETAYTVGFPTLERLGLKANLAVNPGAVEGNFTTYMTREQIAEVNAAGWPVINHTMGHPHLPEIAPSDIESEIADAKAWIRTSGYSSADVFIVPFHDWDERELEIIRRYHRAARGISTNPPYTSLIQAWPEADPYALTGFEPSIHTVAGETGMSSARVRADLLAELDRVIDQGQVIDIFFHRILPEEQDGFRLLMEEVAKRSDRFRTYAQLFPN